MNSFFDTKLEFSKKKHKYVYEDTELTSVTTFIGEFFTPFNADAVAHKLAKFPVNKDNKRGVRYWKSKWKDSQVMGTNVHKEMEDFIEFNKEVSLPKSIQGTKFIKDNDLLNTENIILSELKVFSLKNKLAGTIDALIFNKDRTVTICDWKTNEKIEKTAYGKKVGIRRATVEVPDSNYWHYALQLNLYRKILQEDYGLVINELILVHLKDDSYEVIQIPLMEDILNRMLGERNEKTS